MRIIKTSVFVVFLLAFADLASAQSLNSGGASSSGLFGQRSLGSTLSAGNRTFGRNPAPITGSGSVAGQGNVGQVDSSDRFLRQNRRPGQFVGADPTGGQGFVGAVQAGQGTGPAGRSSITGAGGARSDNANQPGRGDARRTYSIRASLSVAFSYNGPQAAKVGRDLAAQLARCPRLKVLKPVKVDVAEGTVKLSGTVATREDRAMAEQLVRLEPGVWKVVNEIVVNPEP